MSEEKSKMIYNGTINLREPIIEHKPNFPPRTPDAPVSGGIEPFKIMDDMFFVGRQDTGVIVLKTSEGLVIIDALEPFDAAERYILPGLEKLGLGNEKVLACFISHGHFDHHCGAGMLREKTGCKLYMSETDAGIMPNPDPRGKVHPYPDHIDVFVNDGDEFTFGDKTVFVASTPGHSPGGISFIFPVSYNGEQHVACIWGGTGIPKGRLLDNCTYVKSAAYFAQLCAEKGADVEVSAHPFVDQSVEKGEILKNLKAGDPNPFIIGQKGVAEFFYQRIISGMTEIAEITNNWDF